MVVVGWVVDEYHTNPVDKVRDTSTPYYRSLRGGGGGKGGV